MTIVLTPEEFSADTSFDEEFREGFRSWINTKGLSRYNFFVGDDDVNQEGGICYAPILGYYKNRFDTVGFKILPRTPAISRVFYSTIFNPETSPWASILNQVTVIQKKPKGKVQGYIISNWPNKISVNLAFAARMPMEFPEHFRTMHQLHLDFPDLSIIESFWISFFLRIGNTKTFSYYYRSNLDNGHTCFNLDWDYEYRGSVDVTRFLKKNPRNPQNLSHINSIWSTPQKLEDNKFYPRFQQQRIDEQGNPLGDIPQNRFKHVFRAVLKADIRDYIDKILRPINPQPEETLPDAH